MTALLTAVVVIFAIGASSVVGQPTVNQRCDLCPTGQDCYLTGFGQNEYVCDCGSRNGFSRIGPTCETTPDGITVDRLDSCYGDNCRTGSYQSPNWNIDGTGFYEARDARIFLLFIPGATRIVFQFEGPFGVEVLKDDLYVGVGLEFGIDQVSSDFVGQLDNGNIYHFDNRSLSVPNQGVPASFALETDTVWIYFGTDKNIELAGFRLTWNSTVDTSPPIITQCPSPITETVASIRPVSAAVTWQQPFANDGCCGLITTPSFQSHAPGDLFPEGTTDVTYTFTDLNFNVATCTFSVTVIRVDDIPPVVTCGPDITRQTPISSGGLSINFPECTATDDSGTVTLVSRTHNPGQFFAVDTTAVVIYTFTDPTGNRASDSFTITVLGVDDIPPVVTCGPDITRQTPISSGGLSINFPECTATDDSGTVTLVSRTHNPGQFFGIDTQTIVTYTFTDGAGNRASDSFTITVQGVDNIPPVVTCGPDITRQTPISSGGLSINFPECTATDDSGTVTLVSRTHNPGQFFGIDTQTIVIYTFTDGAGNRASDSFTINVIGVDDIPPVVTCGPDITRQTPISSGGLSINFPECTATDDSGTVTLVSRTHNPGQFFGIDTQTVVVYTFTDGAGNRASDSFTINVIGVDDIPPVVTCGPDITRQTPISSGGLSINFPECTATDDSGTVTLVSRTHNPGQFFGIGTQTIVTYTFTDGAGNRASDSFTINVIGVDDILPVVTCGPDITRQTPISSGGLSINFPECTATDDSGTVTLVSRTHNPGQFFGIDTQTVVVYTFTDGAGNRASDSFTINVIGVDDIPPVVTCGPDITRQTPISSGGLSINFPECTATDDSGTVTLVSRTHNPGQFFGIGTQTIVTYTFTDGAGNRASDSFTINVIGVDDILPVVTCGPDITRQTPISSGGLSINFPECTATDDSGTVTLVSRTHNPGQFFGIDTQTVVTYTFTDGAGNRASDSFTINVIGVDDILPVVTCGPDITRQTPISSGGLSINFPECTATDDSGTVTLVSRTHNPGQFFGIDTQTIVTYTFTDGAGNRASDSFTINVIGVDDIPPVVTCGPDIVQTTPSSTGGRMVDFQECTAEDNSGVVNLISRSQNPGAFFPIGDTEVTYTFSDPNGNTASATFLITVVGVDVIPPRVACVQDILETVPLESLGTTVFWTEPTATDESGAVSLQQRSHAPGSFFSVGSTTVTYIFVDASGNTADCIFTITVQAVDDIAPVVRCVPDVSENTPFGSQGTSVFFAEPTSTDNSGVVSLQQRSHAPGSFFMIGATVVTYIFVDAAGNTAECTFTITVVEVDNTPPDVTCIQDITRTVAIDSTGTTVFWTEPTAADNSGVVSLQSRSHAPGDFFGPGTTQVTYIFADPSGNTAFCIFTVTVTPEDNVLPVVSCIPDVTETTALGTGGRLVFYTEPTATDDSGVVSLQQRTHGPGTFFSSGVTQVTYIFVDPAGNTAECSFRVIVTEIDGVPPVIACVGLDVTETIPLNGFGTTVQFREPTATDNSGIATVQSRTHTPGQFFQSGTTQVTYVFIDPSGNTAECSFNIIITEVDNTPPVVSCINDITQEIPLNSFGVVVQFTEPTATDNSGTASVLSATQRPGQFFQTGTTTVTYIFADPSGNTADCVFDIIVVEVDDTPPDVTCIQDITRIVTIDSTGTTVFWTEPTATDNSGVVSLQSRSHAPGDLFSPGTTQVTYIFVDPSGNTAFCIFTVTVTQEDNVPPVVSCITDVTETTPLGTGGTTVLFTEPTATDDSGVVSLQQRTHGPGTFFSSGVTQVTYIFVDPAGSTAECTFRVIVTEIDTIPPVVACVGLDVTETIPLNGVGTTVQFREPTATDNSGTVNLQSRTNNPGQFFQSGSTTVTYIFEDPSGNTATCTFCVDVVEVDNIPPVVSCISDITREIPLNSFGVVVDFTEPTATDNSGTASVLSATRRPGQFFQTGTTTVTYIFADPSGNTADCVFDISVVEVDDTPPDVTCIQDITRTVTIDSTGTTVFWTEPTATDNSGVVSLQSRSHAPGDFFSPGTTQVTYIFVDPSGQTAFCIFTVTVTPEDNVPPVVSCIPDVTETTALGTGGRLVFYTEPTATDDSGVVSLQQRTHGPGTFFSSGVTQVTYTFVDPAGSTAECTFRVIVTEIDEVPPVIACVGLDVTETIPLNGFGTTVQFREPTATDNSGTATVQSRTHTPGQFFQSGTTEVTYVFIDPSGNTARCSFNIIITEVDNIPPVVSCISDITREIPLNSFGVVVDFTEPTATDNSGTASVLSATRRPGQFFQTGTTTVTYIFADPSGNTADCVFDISVVEVDDTPPDVTCIQDITRTVTIDSTGTTVFWTEPTATDNSEVVSLQSRSHAPGDFFSPGTTQVTYIFVDPSGQTAFCIFTVTVTPEDNVPPVVSCIPDVTETTALGTGGRLVFYTEPTATDDSGVVSLQQRTHGPGTFFSSGVTQVTYTFVDPAGSTAECTFRVIVTEIDEVPPVIACVGLDVTETIPLNGFGTTVQFREPTATDNSGTATVQSRTHTPGQFFQSGTTEVTYVFIDPSGNTARCSFNIIITEVDNIPPVVSCISDITREIPLNSFGVVVDFTEPTATDNSGTASVLSATRRPGQFFQTGTTTVTYIFADPSGNTADCVFDISVVEVDDTPPDVTCIQDITRTVTIDSTGTTVFWTEPTATDNSGVVSLQSRSHAPGDFFSPGTTQVTYIFVDPSGQTAFCIFTVTVTPEDNVLPVVSCIPDVTETTALGTGGRLVFYTEPTATDDSGVVSLQQRTHGPGTFFSSGVTQVTYIFVDPAGNTAECTFRVIVTEIDEVPPVIACVGLDVTETIPLNGFGTTVQFREPTATDNSGTATVQSRTHTPGQFFQSGTTEVTYVFIDPSGNTARCSFNIIITEVDNIPPVVSCISDITREIPLNSFGVVVDFTEPTATDNSGTASVLSATRRSGQFFQTGTTTVTYIFADPSGNTADCVFDISVVEVDDTPPDVTCIQDITRTVTIDSTGTTVFWTEPTATDNSGVVSLQSRSHAPGDFFSPGTTQVTYIFVDPSGQTAFCIFTVTVTPEDNVLPVVSCIPDVTETTALGTGGRLVFYTEPTATDDSGVVSLQQRTHGPGTFFSSGVTQVTYIFVDPAGNTAECTFRVIVTEIDTIPPVVACVGLDVTETIPLNGFGTTVQFREPTATDNSGTVNLQSRTNNPGQFFQSGSTTVTYIFEDPSGNTATCTFCVDVVEVDNIPPVVSCISDITREIPLNSFGVVVDFTEPTATDNSGTASVLSATRRPGQFFQTGTTTVTYIFADPSGNTADCVFDISVVEVDDTPPDVTCIQDITRTVTIDSTGTTVFWTEPTATDNSGVVSLQSRSHAPGDFFSPGTTQVTYIFVDPSGQTAFCIFTVTVTPEDNVLPVVSCIPDVTETTALGTGGRLVFYTEPTATDDSGVVSLQQRTHGPGTFFSSGVTQVTYIFVDPAGNTAECTFRVIVTEIDEVPPVIACVGLDVTETIPLNGFGTTVQFREPTATDNSGTATVQSRTHTPGQFFQSGTTEVTYVFIDPSGNTARCSFNIIITEVDNIPPVVSCINDITREIPLNSFGVVVQFTEPTATDNSGTASVLSATQRPGQFFQTGTTTVTYIFADPSGNTADCVFDISVVEVDDQPPQVICPPDVRVTVELGLSRGTATWTAPVATDDSGVVELVTQSHFSNSMFPVGETQVMYIYRDGSGNTADCTFNVIVSTVDNTPPQVTCPTPIDIEIEIGTPAVIVTWSAPVTFDLNVPVVLQSQSHTSGQSFSIGTTTVTYRYADAAGNIGTCSFPVTVIAIDDTPPDVTCIQDITRIVTIDSTGTTVSWTEPTATDNSGVVSLQSRSHAPGDFFSPGTTQVTYIFVDPSGQRAFCIFTVTVTPEDNVLPVVSCIPDVTETTAFGTGGRLVFYTEPTATDDSGVVSLQQRTHGPGTFFSSGVTQVTYIFVDPAGNTAECTFRVIVTEIDQVPPVIACVGLDVTETIPLNGFGTTVQFSEPTATDNSGTANVQSRTHTPGQFFQSGTTQVTYVFIDPSGNTAECSFNIIITEVDNIPPVVSCINDITREIPLNSFGVVVQFTEPTATDNSGTASVLSATRRPGQFFQTGTTTVTYIFADPSGNTADCVFDIIVVEIDDTPPDVTCIQDITRIVTIDSTGITVSWTEPTAADNSGVVSLQSRSHAPGDFFSPGTTQVTYIFVDPSGQTAFCIFTVTVTPEDNVPPVVSCIPDVTETTALGTGGRLVFYTEPTATDDSGVVSLQQRTHNPGTFFSSGVTQVNYIFVDPAGNTAECTFRVIVTEIDQVPPVIACVGLDVTETIPLNGFGTTVQFREPTATDNSGTANVQSRTHTPGQFFQSGTTQVTYVFADLSGNTAECSFNIIVTEVDNIPPVVSCINDITREIPLNSFGVVVQFTEPTATDNSGTASVLSATRRPGQFFQTGTTTVTYIFADPNGNTADCVFDIIVVEVDNTPPQVTCPTPIDIEIEIGTTGVIVTWSAPVTFDLNVPVVLQSQSHASGNLFSIGTTTVTYIYADAAGNIGTCSFPVTVIASDNTPPVIQDCPDFISGILVFGETVSVAWPPITATDNSGQPPAVDRSHNSGDQFPFGVTNVIHTFTDAAGNSAVCSFIVNVGSSSVTSCCPSPIFREVPLNSGGIAVEWVVVCNLEQFNIQEISSSHRSGQTFNVGTTEVTLTFADGDNFQMSCSFPITITQVDDEPPQVVCIDFTAVAPINSGGIVVDFPAPTATDNSGTASVVSSTATPGVFFRTGDTTVTYIFSDPSGNSAQCSFVVTVEEIDSERPSLTCSGNIVLTVLEGVTERSVSWVEPVVMDNSGTVSLASQSHRSGDSFPVGTTTVLYTYQDPSGNVATCSFDIIIVTDNPCQINTCLNGGSCIALDLDTTMCVCPRCFEGDICQFAIDPCEGNLCGSGSTCIPVPDSCTLYTCECPRCFTGQFCTEVGNVCDANDCVNGAVCQPDPVDCTLYVCQCPPCFSGSSCEQRADGCVPNPCVNSGICSNLNIMECNAYRCDCVGCFSGYNCELPIPNPCDNFPCLNGGTCTRNIEVCASYTCRCQTGFDGDNCEQQVIALANPCNSFPCRNGASCMSAPGETTYVCLCRSGYSGINCDMMSVPGADLCSINTCQNGGNCFVSFDSGSPAVFYQPQYVCLCAAGFTGFNCFSNTALVAPDMDPCSQSTGPGCLNGGTCVNTYNSFSRDVDYVCTCVRPYTGKNCERTYVDPCNSAPCQFGGTCTSFQEYFICTCDVGFMGTFCHIPTLDITAPVVRNCPENIVLNSRFNEPVVGVWIAPTASDDSGFVDVLFVSHMSGFLFPPGDTAVSYIYVDPSNNQAACSFVVSVLGSVTVPAISIVGCPGDINLRTLTGSAVALWTSPTASSSSGQTLNTVQSQFSGSSFNLGTTVVIYTYSDSLGNQASCIFTVNVAFETGISIRNCPTEVRVTTTDPNGRAVATWTEPEGTAANPPVMRVSTHRPGTPFPVGSTTVTYTFTDNSANRETCIFPVIVTVSTAAIRILNCPNDITQPAGFGGAGTEFTWTPPTGFDSLNNAIIPQANRNPPVFLSPNQELMITYTFISGTDISTCTFTLRVGGVIGDNVPPSVISQPDTIVLILRSEQTSVTANWVEPLVTDNSGTVTLLRQSHFSGASRFSVGRTAVEYLYSDPAGNQLTVTFDVIVNDINDNVDTTPPVVFRIPEDIVATFSPTESAVVTWDEPLAFDESGPATLITRSHEPGSVFPDGVTQVFYVFSDLSENTVFISFTVTVIRITGPPAVSNCPANIIRSVPSGTPEVSVTWIEPQLSNIAGSIPIEEMSSHNPADFFPVGVTTVTYSFNVLDVITLNCSFEVRVSTTVANQIQIPDCPTDMTVELPTNETFVIVTWTVPTATFNGNTIQPLTAPPTNSAFFQLGSTPLTYAYRVRAITAECSFTINVFRGNQLPVMGKRAIEDSKMSDLPITVEENPCSGWNCANGGECFIHVYENSFYPLCRCADGWQGETCEEVAENEEISTDWFILLMMISAIAIFALLFALSICQIKRQSRTIKHRAEEKVVIQ
ncbi:uncharacterized protein [Apostichopus japonicus]|uniref:uncharacterized protein isoform X3 n=1 Tax=Stichopus japonicus TaxID=307972 RepID=UPI003AB31BDA